MEKKMRFWMFLLCAVVVFGMADGVIAAQVSKKQNERKDLERTLQLEINDVYYKAKVGGESACEALRIRAMSSQKEYILLYMDMMHTDTAIYLDELLENTKVAQLTIKNGGFITVKNSESINDNELHGLEFYHVNKIKGDILNGLNDLHEVVFRLDERFEGYETLAEICSRSDCENIIVEYENDDNGSLLQELAIQMPEKEFLWQKLMRVDEEEYRHLGAVYQLNKENYRYTSYEFYGNGDDRDVHPHVFLVIERKDADIENDFDIIEIESGDSPEIGRYGGNRICLEDINFDGHEDIIFAGSNESYKHDRHISFLWNPHSGRYERNKTAPVYVSFIDKKRKRITDTVCMSVSDDTYYIYEYRDGIFYEKKLHVVEAVEAEKTESIEWEYSENGNLIEWLVWEPEISDGENYTFYSRDGKVIHGRFTRDEGMYSDLGMQFFSEFDFYAHG